MRCASFVQVPTDGLIAWQPQKKYVTAADFNIHTLDDFEHAMCNELLYLNANASAVRRVLPRLEFEWPESCSMLRESLASFGV